MDDSEKPQEYKATSDGSIIPIDMNNPHGLDTTRFIPAPFRDPVVKPIWHYTQSFAEKVAELIIEGKSLTAICKMDCMPPYSTICFWRANNVTFDAAIKKAKQMRGEHFRDEIERSLKEDEIADAKDASILKLKFEKLKYLASTDNPDEFGTGKGNAGDTNIQVIIETGVPARNI